MVPYHNQSHLDRIKTVQTTILNSTWFTVLPYLSVDKNKPPLKFVVKLNRDVLYIFCADTLQLIVSAACSLIAHKHTRRQQHGQINNSYQPCFRVATVFCLLINVCDHKFTQSILILYYMFFV